MLLAQVYGSFATLAMMVNPIAGQVIYVEAENRARELIRVARHHKPLMKIIDNIIAGNDYTSCFLGHAAMIGAIFALSDKLPENPITFMLKMSGMSMLQKWNSLSTNQDVAMPFPERSGYDRFEIPAS